MEAQPRFWKLFAYSFAPVGIAVVVGLWLAGRIHGDPVAVANEQRTDEVQAQDRLLVDGIWGAIETVKSRALGLARLRDAELKAQGVAPSPSNPDGPILHWAELELQGGKLKGIIQAARNPGFEPAVGWAAFESFYLQSAISRLNLHELQENGVTLLRIKREEGHSQEWLALAFERKRSDATGNATAIVLALVDPVEIFPVFRRWASRGESGNLRGYLVGSDGFVLAHSQRTYAGSDFRSVPVFEQGVLPMLKGQARGGAGVYASIDKLAVTAAFARPGTLPLGVVVERVNPAMAQASAWWGLSPEAYSGFGGALAAVMGLAAVMAMSFARVVQRNPVPQFSVRQAAPTEAAVEVYESAVPVAPQPEQVYAQEEIHPLPDMEDQIAEELLSARAANPRAQAEHHARVLIAQFDDQSQKARDSRSVAKSLAVAASGIAGAPALFFGYREGLKACLLEAHSSLRPGLSTEALSFRLTDLMLARIDRYQKEGRVASLSDDPNLALLMARRLSQRTFEALAVTAPKTGRLLGVLVTLDDLSARARSGEQGQAIAEGMHELVRASAARYLAPRAATPPQGSSHA
jgi:hypothetical protein